MDGGMDVCMRVILCQNVSIYLVHLLPWSSAEVLQREVSNDLPIVPTAHVHNQEPVVLISIYLMQREHWCCTVFHLTLLCARNIDLSGLTES